MYKHVFHRCDCGKFVLGYLTQVILEYNFAFSLGDFSSETQTDLLSRTYPRIYMEFLQEPPYVWEAKPRFLAYVSFNQPTDSGHPSILHSISLFH